MVQKRITGRELARRTGWTPSRVTLFIRGEISTSFNRMTSIAEALGVDLPEIFASTIDRDRVIRARTVDDLITEGLKKGLFKGVGSI